MRKNDAFDAKIVNTRLTKIFIAIFAPDERLPNSATLLSGAVSSYFMAAFSVLDFWNSKCNYYSQHQHYHHNCYRHQHPYAITIQGGQCQQTSYTP